jgi:hypothetical protein
MNTSQSNSASRKEDQHPTAQPVAIDRLYGQGPDLE